MANSILLVDDEPHILETAKDILEAADYLVRTAETGEAALRSLRESPSDLMIVDYNLNDITGVELTLAARQIHPALAVILMTGEASVDLGPAKAMIAAILTKPVNPPELIALIRRTI